MTEAEWLACGEPRRMLRALGREASLRKMRLFACACCRRVWPLLTEARSRSAVEVAERYADGAATNHERAVACEAAFQLDWELRRERGEGDSDHAQANAAALSASDANVDFLPSEGDEEDYRAWEHSCQCAAVTVEYRFTRETHRHGRQREKAQKAALRQEMEVQASLVRCIFGGLPPHPSATGLTISPTFCGLALAAYEERLMPSGEIEPARLAVLSDALEEAGCADADILSHLRSAGPHVRGCWALDLVLGKG